MGSSSSGATTTTTVTIERLAVGGDGVGLWPDGRVCFVPWTAPGDVVTATVREEHSRHVFAAPTAWLTRGADRVEPRCPLFSRCGGCRWQHLPYPVQVATKTAHARDQFDRFFRRGSAGVVADTLSAADPWAYRSRVRVMLADGRFGLHGPGDAGFVAVQHCAIADPALFAALGRIPAPIVADLERGGWTRIDVRADLHGVDLYAWGRGQGPAEQALASALVKVSGIRGARIGDALAGNPVLHWTVAGAELQARAGAFTQVPLAMNDRLVRHVLAAAGPAPRRVLELFAGGGNFGVPLARAGHEVLALESDAGAVADGWLNARAHDVAERLRWLPAGDAARLVQGTLPIRPDVVLLDPPYAGAKAVVPAITQLGAARILYVACHLAALTRDAQAIAARGYTLTTVQPFDFFPQTAHVELLAVFDRAASG